MLLFYEWSLHDDWLPWEIWLWRLKEVIVICFSILLLDVNILDYFTGYFLWSLDPCSFCSGAETVYLSILQWLLMRRSEFETWVLTSIFRFIISWLKLSNSLEVDLFWLLFLFYIVSIIYLNFRFFGDILIGCKFFFNLCDAPSTIIVNLHIMIWSKFIMIVDLFELSQPLLVLIHFELQELFQTLFVCLVLILSVLVAQTPSPTLVVAWIELSRFLLNVRFNIIHVLWRRYSLILHLFIPML
jgi:hypothetical protein